MLLHNRGQGLVVVSAGRLVLRAAEIPDACAHACPSGLFQIELRTALKARSSTPEAARLPPAVPAADRRSHFSECYLIPRSRHADSTRKFHWKKLSPCRCMQHMIRQLQLPASGGKILVHIRRFQPKIRRIQNLAVVVQAVSASIFATVSSAPSSTGRPSIP
jgi:hypothetical protein